MTHRRTDGFANAYDFGMRGLNVLNLSTPEFTVLNNAMKSVIAAYRHAFRAIELAVCCRPDDCANYDAFVNAPKVLI